MWSIHKNFWLELKAGCWRREALSFSSILEHPISRAVDLDAERTRCFVSFNTSNQVQYLTPPSRLLNQMGLLPSWCGRFTELPAGKYVSTPCSPLHLLFLYKIMQDPVIFCLEKTQSFDWLYKVTEKRRNGRSVGFF